MKDKGLLYSLSTIAAVLVFTFTLAEYVNEMGHVKVSWLHQTDKDVIYELRSRVNRLELALGFTNQENRCLRRLVYTTKPDHWATWLELMDYCKVLEKKNEEIKKEIKILEIKLGIRSWPTLPSPFKEM